MTARRVVFLSMENPPAHVVDDDLALHPLAERGVEVELKPWSLPIDWSEYDAAVIRSTWDYVWHSERFLGVLAEIPVPLFNAVETVVWNYNKIYLNRYAEWTLPSHFHQGSEIDSELLGRYLTSYREVVIKPAVGLGGNDTFLLSRKNEGPDFFSPERLWMIQPLAPSIRTEGELSLVYFQKEFSHAVLKKPSGEEFRIHQQFGGSVEFVEPEAQALTVGRSVLNETEDDLLYARVDLVKYEGDWRLMELEAIEPSLYFEYDKRAPERFAEALVSRLAGGEGVVV